MFSGLSAVLVAASIAVSAAMPRTPMTPMMPAAHSTPKAHRSAAKIAGGAVLGAAAGLFAGGFVGYKFERGFKDCRCDDPGIRGLLIGAPIGAVLGAILGGKFIFRQP